MMEQRKQMEAMMVVGIHRSFADDETVAQRAASAVFNMLWPEIEKLIAFQSDATTQILELHDKVNGLIQQIPLTKYIPHPEPEAEEIPERQHRKSTLSLVEPSAPESPTEDVRRNRPIEGRAGWASLPVQTKKEIEEMDSRGYNTPEELMAAKRYIFRIFAGFEKKQGKSFHRISQSAIWLFPRLNFMMHSASNTKIKQLWHGFQQFRDEYEFWLSTNKAYANNLSLPPVAWDNKTCSPAVTAETVTVTDASGNQSKTITVNPDTTYKEGPSPKKRGRKPGAKIKSKVLTPPVSEEKKELVGAGA